jgi:glycogen synthase
VTETKTKVWIFTFEYAGVVKVGGLGEVPANQAKHLSKNFDITAFMPSHGQLQKLKEKYPWVKLEYSCNGLINASYFSNEYSESFYQIGYYQFELGNVKIVVLAGENEFTAKYLEDQTVYSPDTIMGKICLFSIGIRGLVKFLIENESHSIPELVHMHDYHVVMSFISMKQILAQKGLEVPAIITIHLLTYPRYELSFYKLCGIDNNPIKIVLSKGPQLLRIDEIYHLAHYPEEGNPTVERIGAIVSDLVTTVSESYLKSDIIPNCGNELIEFKADFIWDGCDWDYNDIFKEVIKNHQIELSNYFNTRIFDNFTRGELKKFLLEYKIGNLVQSPLINSQRVLEAINEISNGNPFIKNGNIKAFSETGPLVLTTGRISPQKGFETILEAVPYIVEYIPNVKFLFLILPTDYSLHEIKSYSKYVKEFPNNIRIIFGVASDIFYLAHISADVYCALSRWEPFGIMALEAMASKIPIIATKVGGLQETIIDMRYYSDIGTGILIDKDNPKQFANALLSLLKSLEVYEKTKFTPDQTVFNPELLKVINQIPDEVIKSSVLLNPNYYNKIQENCYRRVKKNFTWKKVSQKLSDLYFKIIHGNRLA